MGTFDINIEKAKESIRSGKGPVFRDGETIQHVVDLWDDEAEEWRLDFDNFDHFKYWLIQTGRYVEDRT